MHQTYAAELPSVRAFLEGLFDYAGLFPPAALPMQEAAREYDVYRKGKNAWMIGPFVVPVSRLDELGQEGHLFDTQFPLALDVLPRSASTLDALEETLTEDLVNVRAFLKSRPGQARFESMEFRFPPDSLDALEDAQRIHEIVDNAMTKADCAPTRAFVELVRRPGFESDLTTFFSALTGGTGVSLRPGAKLRCGGADAEAYPSPGQIARFIRAAGGYRHPFKMTAGLHHPVRHVLPDSGILMHGFLNVFFASVLTRVHDLDLSTVTRILEDLEPSSFRFTPEGIAWKDLSATTDELRSVRTLLALSIGSCSFDEPRDDLRDLGWLHPASTQKQ